jgi:pimeloyl-ACP methyl ester carboxylesterase
MAGLVTPLVLAGFDTVAIDLPGHGFSSGLFADLPACLRALRDVADVLGSPMTVVGHGLGGSIAAMACVRSSNFATINRVERLVLIGAPDRMTDVVNRFAEEFLNKEETILLLHELVDGFLHGPSACFSTASAVWSSACAILVIHDKNDPLVPHEDAITIASHMKEGKLVSTDRLGHRRILRVKSVSREVTHFVEEGLAKRGTGKHRHHTPNLPELKLLLGGVKGA